MKSSKITPQNEVHYMSRCLQLANLGEYYVAPNPMVGAVLVYHTESGDKILGEGWHERYGSPHAEPNCLRNAEERYPEGIDYAHCTLYVNLEPCSHYGKTPPCASLIIQKGVGRVVIGTLDPNPQVAGRGVAMMREAGVEVLVGVLEGACRELNKRFFCLHEQYRPYVILKWAQTADGYLDWKRDVGTKPLRISTPLLKQLVHQKRAENMAIMVGTRTVLLDNPCLKTTHWSGRNPIRITFDRHNVIPVSSNILSNDADTIVYKEDTSWEFVLNDLAKRKVHSLLVEGGSCLLNMILKSGIYDEVHVEVSPVALGVETDDADNGGVGAPVMELPETSSMIDGHAVYVLKNSKKFV